MSLYTLIIFAACCLPLGLALVAFFHFLPIWIKDVGSHSYNRVRRFNPDRNGNYPAFYDPRSGRYFLPPSGNNAHPDNVMIYNGVVKEVKPLSEPKLYHNQSPVEGIPVTGQAVYYPPAGLPSEGSAGASENVQTDGAAWVNEVMNGRSEAGERANAPELARTEQEFRALLSDAKERGIGKQAAIEGLGLARKGGSKAWAFWSNVWDNLGLAQLQAGEGSGVEE